MSVAGMGASKTFNNKPLNRENHMILNLLGGGVNFTYLPKGLCALLVSTGFKRSEDASPGLCRILPFSLFCAGFVLVSAGLCWSLPVSLFSAGFLLVSTGFVVL